MGNEKSERRRIIGRTAYGLEGGKWTYRRRADANGTSVYRVDRRWGGVVVRRIGEQAAEAEIVGALYSGGGSRRRRRSRRWRRRRRHRGPRGQRQRWGWRIQRRWELVLVAVSVRRHLGVDFKSTISVGANIAITSVIVKRCEKNFFKLIQCNVQPITIDFGYKSFQSTRARPMGNITEVGVSELFGKVSGVQTVPCTWATSAAWWGRRKAAECASGSTAAPAAPRACAPGRPPSDRRPRPSSSKPFRHPHLVITSDSKPVFSFGSRTIECYVTTKGAMNCQSISVNQSSLPVSMRQCHLN